MKSRSFQFLDPGPLVDGELELVEPSAAWLDPMLEACHHPLTTQYFPAEAKLTRQDLMRFVETYPRGHQGADPGRGLVPAYHFWMRLRPHFAPPLTIAGGIGLRIGHTPHILLYGGHIGYHVYPPARGRNYARRACQLLLPLARRHGFRELWITTNPDNFASRKTCEGLGASLVEIIPIPQDDPLYARGERHKCRYRLELV